MEHLKVGNPISIVAYKHNGDFHRLWRKATIIEATPKKIIVMNNKTTVQETNGKEWYTKEPAICIFYPDKWFNIICMLKPSGIQFYCNLASPIIIDKTSLKYIDYDIDVKSTENNKFKILDQNEYNANKEKYNYPKEIDIIISQEIKKIEKMILNKEDPFNEDFVFDCQIKYDKNIKKSLKSHKPSW